METIRGNISLLGLTLTVLLIWAWRWLFEIPAATRLSLFGLDAIPMAWLSDFQTFILGSLGLSTIVMGSNVTKLIANFYNPYEQLKGEELKRFYAAKGTVAFSIVAFLLSVAICSSNISILIDVDPKTMDLVVRADGGRDASFIVYPDDADAGAPRSTRQARLGRSKVRLLLRGWNARALLLVRDKFNLTTLDAVRVTRRGLGVEYDLPAIEVEPAEDALLTAPETKLLTTSTTVDPSARTLNRSLFSLDLSAPFRYSKKLPNRIIGAQGALFGPKGKHHLYNTPGDVASCPDRAPDGEAEIQGFWNNTCEEKDLLVSWTDTPSFREGSGLETAWVDLSHYRVSVRFVEGVVRGDRPLHTKEAVQLIGTHRDWLEKGLPSSATDELGVVEDDGTTSGVERDGGHTGTSRSSGREHAF